MVGLVGFDIGNHFVRLSQQSLRRPLLRFSSYLDRLQLGMGVLTMPVSFFRIELRIGLPMVVLPTDLASRATLPEAAAR